MRFFLPVLAAALMVGGFAHAGELDNEAQVTNETKALSKDLPQTLVIRTNAATGEVQVMHSSQRLQADMSTTAIVAKGVFHKADLNQVQAGSELDRDSSQSSWYFCWNRGFDYGYPYYWYGGYNFSYSYYYGYNWGGWNYSYYRWNWGWY